MPAPYPPPVAPKPRKRRRKPLSWAAPQRWRRTFRYFYLRFLRLRGSPREIARGLAAGVFAGAFPFFGFQTIFGIALAAVVRGNKIMAAAGTWISNPLTYVPIYAFNFKLGSLLLGMSSSEIDFSSQQSIREWMSMGMDISAALIVGSCLVGLVASVIGYSVGLNLAVRYRQARRQKRQRGQRGR
ncbi:DUF2062 domain-containing protein [Romeria aff. gracilis LEGE 07310]|uniref:DUF2062 domain-containing protein n=1 Tax=Vasconcelosia minhoensis LEGE 07310 TaxID=915328 RepID=A0A8J7AI00_9CYAN|nr:DUF2062 domain-containing protein [Romeria gracilis]MBE9079304.1 DUF2062 domain-containing protein [Romeria aff. gracilis LEGE 07310]